MDSSKDEEDVRRKVHRIYGSVCLLQILFGLLMIICGLIAISLRENAGTSGTPYFVFGFLAGILIVSAGVCTLYVFCTRAALLDIEILTAETSRRRRQAIIGNQALSVLCVFACLLGAFACGVFAFRECDSSTWWSVCEFSTKQLENKVTSAVLLVFLGISAIISLYASIISCCYGWVFVKRRETRKPEVPNSTGFPKVFVTPDDHSADLNMIESDTKRKQFYSYDSDSEEEDNYPEPEQEGLLSNEQTHEQTRLHHLQMQQTPNYIAVLNDPAMKQKLQERNTKLQQV